MMDGGVAAVGECMLELSGAGAPGDAGWRMGFAGDTFNTLWTLSALSPDRRADYVTAFGDDPFSAQQIAFMKNAGIDIAESPVIPGARPGLYAITLKDAERSFTYWRSDAAARQLASDPARLAKSLEDRALVYFSGITLAILEPDARKALIRALGAAKSAGALVAFDPNYRPRLWPSADAARAAVEDALSVTTVALPTFPDEATLHGEADIEATAGRFLASGVAEVAVKDGEKAALVVRDGQSRRIPAIRVEAVDTTGAGDSFNGAYLAARLAGEAPDAAAVKAHRVAAAVIQVHGALAPVETLRRAFAG